MARSLHRTKRNSNRGAKDPTRKQISRFHTGTADIRTTRSGARASRHPPRWRAQLELPGNGTRAADRTLAAVRSAVPILRDRNWGKRGLEGQWAAGSEVKDITRLMRKAGCLSRPLFAVCLKLVTPFGAKAKPLRLLSSMAIIVATTLSVTPWMRQMTWMPE